jgi:hypothetical protein
LRKPTPACHLIMPSDQLAALQDDTSKSADTAARTPLVPLQNAPMNLAGWRQGHRLHSKPMGRGGAITGQHAVLRLPRAFTSTSRYRRRRTRVSCPSHVSLSRCPPQALHLPGLPLASRRGHGCGFPACALIAASNSSGRCAMVVLIGVLRPLLSMSARSSAAIGTRASSARHQGPSSGSSAAGDDWITTSSG